MSRKWEEKEKEKVKVEREEENLEEEVGEEDEEEENVVFIPVMTRLDNELLFHFLDKRGKLIFLPKVIMGATSQ